MAVNYDLLHKNLQDTFKLRHVPLTDLLRMLRQEGVTMVEIATGSKGEASESTIRRILRGANIP